MHIYAHHSCTIPINEHENATLFINEDNELSIEYVVEQNHIYQGIVKDTADVGMTNFYHIVKTELENKHVTTQFTTQFCILQVDYDCNEIVVKYKLFLPCHSKKIYGLAEKTIDCEDVYESFMHDSLSKLMCVPYPPSDSETSSCGNEVTLCGGEYVTVARQKSGGCGAKSGECTFIDFGELGGLLQRLLGKEYKPRVYNIDEQIVVFGLFMTINGKFTMDRLLAVFEDKKNVLRTAVVFDGNADCVKKWIVDELRRGLAEMAFDKEFL